MKPSLRHGVVVGLTAAVALSAIGVPASADRPSEPVAVQLLSITDFHGRLQPVGRIRDSEGELIPAGGAAYLSAHLEELRRGHQNSLFFSNGDNYSGFDEETEKHNDESTIELLNLLDLDFANVGNHELDVSVDFLTDHMGTGKCYGVPGVDSCFTDSTGATFEGADFPQYSANVATADREKPVVRGVHIERYDGPRGSVRVAVINAVLPALDELRNAGGHNLSYHPDLTTLPVAATINANADRLRRRGIEAIVANVHTGAIHRSGGYDECIDPHGELIDLNAQLSPEIDAVVGGHTHHTLNCMLDDPAGSPRPVIQAAMDGRVVNEMNLQLDPRSGEVIREQTVSTNHAVTRDIEPDPAAAAIASYWLDRLPETEGAPVGRIAATIDGGRDDSGESSLGNLVADSFLAETREDRKAGADLALVRTEPGHDVGADLRYGSDGVVTYGEAWDSVGSRDPLVSVEVTGAQLDEILEAQWTNEDDGSTTYRPLAVSRGVRYTYDRSRPVGDRVDLASLRIHGQPVSASDRYRVAALPPTIFSTDSPFSEPFRGFSDPNRHARAREAFRWYLRGAEVVDPPAPDRVGVHG